MYKNNKICSIVLAGGRGKRMHSVLPKVLHKLSGRPILDWVLSAVINSNIKDICLIIGESLNTFNDIIEKYSNLNICLQVNRLGTADAVASAYSYFNDIDIPSYAKGTPLKGSKINASHVLICAGDIPTLNPKTLKDFCDKALASNARLSLIGTYYPDPTGYGRLITDNSGNLLKIVEEKDAEDHIKKIDLCNTGIIFAEIKYLFNLLCDVTSNNNQKEYYLTDCFKIARSRGENIYIYKTNNYREFSGINTKNQLKELEEKG